MVIARRLLWLALFGVVLVAGWKFAAANAEPVALDYLIGRVEDVRVWVLVVATFAVGAAAGMVVCVVEMTRLGLLSRRYRRALRRLEAELHGLRSLPLAGDAPAGSPSATEPTERAVGRPGRGA